MSTTDWIVVAGAIVGGIVVGLVLSRVVHMILAKPTRPEPIQQAAGPVSSLALWGGVVAGLLVALGVIQPDSVEQLISDAVSFIPKALTAAIIIILANVLSSFATAAVGKALARASSTVQRQAITITRSTILVMAILLAVPTLGVDTTVVNLGVAALFFALAASFTLLVGLGGRAVAEEIASTRAARRLISKGDVIQIGSGSDLVAGEVVAVHPTAVEVTTSGGATVLVPSSRLMGETMNVRRKEPDPGAGQAD